MWSIYFVNAFQSSTTSNLTAYVVSGFDQHSLIPVISIVSSAMCAACTMPVAKILNLFDRSKGFLAMGVLATIGLILMATCTNIAVYCAAQVFYNVGFTSLIYTIDVMTADTSKLSHRGLAFAFTSSPYIITAFAGPKAAEKFYADNWRWAFGCWAIILPFVVLSLFFVLQGNLRKAKKAGKLQHVPSGRTFMQSVWFYVIEFDREFLPPRVHLVLGKANTTSSSRSRPPSGRPCHLPPALLPCRLYGRFVALAHNYRHACDRLCDDRRVCPC